MNVNFDIGFDSFGLFSEDIIDKILENRGVTDKEHFLNPSEEDLIPCGKLYKIKEASDIVLGGIRDGKKFFINVDSDNDGVSSGAILYRYLSKQGVNPSWYVSQGKTHGTSQELIERLERERPDILIIVDSLDSNIDNYKYIKNLGIDIVVLDHHDINPDIPYDSHITLVSSNRKYPNTELCGAGVTWKFCCYLDDCLGTFDALELVDLACSGTISDMMDMTESHMENREIVNLGLHNLNNLAIKKIVGSYNFNSQAITFSVAPLVNAACRFNKNDDAFMLFITDDNSEILKHLKVLKKCKEQQEIELNRIMPDLIKQAEKQKDNKVIFTVFDSNSGLSGLCGNKLLDIYKRPVFVLKENARGYSGSCRSVGISGFRQLCADTELIKCAGHEEAFGVINIDYDDFENFRDTLEEELKDVQLKIDLKVDAQIDTDCLNDDFINKVKQIDYITGEGFKGLTFLIKTDDYSVTTMSRGKHLVFNITDYVKIILWNKGDQIEKYQECELMAEPLVFVGTLDNGFIGRSYSCRMICNNIISEND